MKPTRLALAACVAALLVPLALVAQQQSPELRILSPADGSVIGGPSVLRAEIVPPQTVPVRVSFFVDGNWVCMVEHPPYECPWDAGSVLRQHQIRVVAQWEGGRRLAQTVTTRDPGYTETVDVDMVHVPVIVTSGGEYVTGLKSQAFRVFEDGVEQPITFFLAEDAPLELVVAIDISGSMAAAMPNVKAAVKQFLTALRPTDQVSLMGFNENPLMLSRPDSDLQTRLKAVDRLESWGMTALYDQIARSLDSLDRGQGRRALVVFTDGDDTASHLSRQELDVRTERSAASLFLVAQGRGVELANLKEVLEHLAAASGGRAFFPDTVEKLPAAFAEIVQDLSHQYVLGYVPKTEDNESHKIRVTVTNSKWKVRAKQERRRQLPGKK